MSYTLKFFIGRGNVEKFRINVRDPVNGDRTESNTSLSKVELIVGNTIISTESGEITWSGNVIQIKPSNETKTALLGKSRFQLVAYRGEEDDLIAIGHIIVVDHS